MNPMLRLLLIFFFLGPLCATAQPFLQRKISVQIKQQPLRDALTIISNEGGFNFSYNSRSLRADSLVSVQARDREVQEILHQLFRSEYEFKESGSYIIIRRKTLQTSSVVARDPVRSEYYAVTGQVLDAETGQPLAEATVYEKNNLLSAMTDETGRFAMKLKRKYQTAQLNVSKDGFEDTTVSVQSNHNQQMTVALYRVQPAYVMGPPVLNDLGHPAPAADTLAGGDLNVERRWLSNVFLSSRQKIRSLNLRRFYTTRTWQFSVVPGLSTHGRMNPQVINRVSVNLIGGYSGGTDAFEVGGLFNIVKRDVRGGQAAGLFNLVGGSVQGVQVSTLYNDVNGDVRGTQVSGAGNVCRGRMKGVQVAMLYNRALSVHGVQVGLVNRTESSEGTSIGLINLSRDAAQRRRVHFLLRLPRRRMPG